MLITKRYNISLSFIVLFFKVKFIINNVKVLNWKGNGIVFVDFEDSKF